MVERQIWQVNLVSNIQINVRHTHKQLSMFGSRTNAWDQYFDLVIEIFHHYKLYECCWTNWVRDFVANLEISPLLSTPHSPIYECGTWVHSLNKQTQSIQCCLSYLGVPLNAISGAERGWYSLSSTLNILSTTGSEVAEVVLHICPPNLHYCKITNLHEHGDISTAFFWLLSGRYKWE